MAGREDDALEVLEALNEKPRTDPTIQTEFNSIKETVVEMSKGSFRSLFDMSEYREFHRVVLAYVNQMFQQISGINLITYYAPTLYGAIGLKGTNINKLLAACNGTEYFLAAFIPIYIIEKSGRRPLMLFGVRSDSSLSLPLRAKSANMCYHRRLECPCRWLSLRDAITDWTIWVTRRPVLDRQFSCSSSIPSLPLAG